MANFNLKFSILALIPIIITVVVLIVAIISFLSSVLSSTLLESIFHSEYRSLAVIILLILLSLYGIRLKRLQIKQKFQCYYCLTQLTLAIGIIIFNSRNPIVFNLIVGTIFGLIFDPKLQNVRTYFQRSRNALVAFNTFDTIFILICYLFKHNRIEINKFIDQVLIQNFIFQDDIVELIYIILSFISLFVLVPFFRGYISVYLYKKQNGICNESGKVFWLSNFKAYLISAFSICIYLYDAFFKNDFSNLYSIFLLYLIFMSLTVLFWTTVYEGIDRGGVDKEAVLAFVALGSILISLMFLLDQIESDFLEILTWFIPVFIPIFIGEVNEVVFGGDSKEPTFAMKKHLYMLQMWSFNTLLVFNIISSISTKQIIKENEVVQVNVLKDFVNSLLKDLDLPSFFTTVILLILSITIGFGLSILMIYLIRRIYIETSDKYFN